MVKGARLWGVAALCLLSGSGWVLTQAYPSVIGWPVAGCIHYGLIACVGLAATAMRKDRKACAPRRLFALCAAGVCLFALPTAALEFASGKVSEFTSVAVYCALPLITILAASSFGIEASDAARLRGLMAPALMGLAGAALLFPVSSPGSLRRWLFLGLVLVSCVGVAAVSVWMYRLMQGVSIALAISVIGAGCSVVLGLYGGATGWPSPTLTAAADEALRCAVFDLPILWLTVWLMREVSAPRLTARFLLVPLVTAVEGFALLREPIESKTIVALLLLLAGGVLLLVKEEPEQVPGLRLK